MSEPIPESIPTSADPRSKRPLKKRALTPVSAQAATVNALFANPDREISIPATSSSSALTSSHSSAPEIVANVQGSSAGAGSGEFHVYKASRRREYERLRAMDEEVAREKGNEEFDKERAEREEKDRERTRKNREKREKMKARKGKKGTAGGGAGTENNEAATPKVPKIKARALGTRNDGEDDAGAEAVATEPQGLVIHDDD